MSRDVSIRKKESEGNLTFVELIGLKILLSVPLSEYFAEQRSPQFSSVFATLRVTDMVDTSDKLTYFQAITGLEDRDLCTEILAAHNWDLELAISSFTSTNSVPSETLNAVNNNTNEDDVVGSSGRSNSESQLERSEVSRQGFDPIAAAPNLAWKLITLPISVISGSLGLVSGAIGLGMWAAGGVLSYSLSMVGLGSGRNGDSSSSLVSVSASVSEAMDFVRGFERNYGEICPNFVTEGFMDALQRSRREFKLLFVYLHSPDHPDTPLFCERTLCAEPLAAFINENFVSWGGSIRASEGFKMSNSLKASRFPFCAVVMAATNQRIALLQQVYFFHFPRSSFFLFLWLFGVMGVVRSYRRFAGFESMIQAGLTDYVSLLETRRVCSITVVFMVCGWTVCIRHFTRIELLFFPTNFYLCFQHF